MEKKEGDFKKIYIQIETEKCSISIMFFLKK